MMGTSIVLIGLDVDRFEVYNRWGRRVFAERNHLNSWRGLMKTADSYRMGCTTIWCFYAMEQRNKDGCCLPRVVNYRRGFALCEFF